MIDEILHNLRENRNGQLVQCQCVLEGNFTDASTLYDKESVREP